MQSPSCECLSAFEIKEQRILVAIYVLFEIPTSGLFITFPFTDLKEQFVGTGKAGS